MSTLIIGFSKPSSRFAFFGRLIMFYQRTDYSHCYIEFATNSGPTLICQASKGMLNFMSPEAFLLNNEVVREFQIELTPHQLAQIKAKSMQKAGLPYSSLQLVGIVIADILGLKKNPFDTNDDTFICSEWVGQILQSVGAKLDKDLSLLTPKDIHDYLEKSTLIYY